MRHSQRFMFALAVVFLLAVSVTIAAADVYTGRAAAVEIATAPAAPAVAYVDTGELPMNGGELSIAADRIVVGLDVLRAEEARSSVEGAIASGEAISSLVHLVAFAGEAAELTASTVRATASATCNSTQGSTLIEGLRFAGIPVIVTGAPNQKITVPGVGALIINEQIQLARTREITVRALHLIHADGRHLIVANVRAGLGCVVAAESRPWQSVKAMYRD